MMAKSFSGAKYNINTEFFLIFDSYFAKSSQDLGIGPKNFEKNICLK